VLPKSERKESAKMVTKTREEILAEMDEAAEKAAEDFKAICASEPDGV